MIEKEKKVYLEKNQIKKNIKNKLKIYLDN